MGRKKARRITATKRAHKAPRRVRSLLKFLKAYGRGADAREKREAFAKRTGTALQYLVQIGYGYRRSSAQMAAVIERNTHGLVTVEELRPDVDWAFLRGSSAKLAPSAPTSTLGG